MEHSAIILSGDLSVQRPSITEYSVAGLCRLQKLKKSNLPIDITINLVHGFQGEIVERLTTGPIERL